MRIDHLQLKNFRGFAKREFRFPGNFIVLAGGNGSGKTSVLDALAVGVGALFLKFSDIKAPPIDNDEVRVVSQKLGQTLTLERQYPAAITCTGTLELSPGGSGPAKSQTVTWIRERTSAASGTLRRAAAGLSKVSEQLNQSVVGVAAGANLQTLPLLAYFGTGRLWLPKRESAEDVLPPGSRMLGYVDCLEPVSSPKPLFRWWKTRELEQLQKGQRIYVLDAVKQAVKDCLALQEPSKDAAASGGGSSGLREIRWDLAADELVAQFESGAELPLHLLSDGYRSMIGLVADLAYRAALLNPQLQDRVLQDTPGVVLIDELDQHLHPLWQRRVVADLRRTFPRVQFIVTTHSPFIIQSLDVLRGESVLSLDGGVRPDDKELSIEDVAESLMGVSLPSRSQRYQEMYEAAKEYYRVLEQVPAASAEEVGKLKQQLDRLSMPFSDDPAYHAFLEMERLAAGLGPGAKQP